MEVFMSDEATDTSAIELATELTIAWLGNPNTRAAPAEASAFLQQMHSAVTALAASPEPVSTETAPEFAPAVSVRRSLASKDHLISLIDGKPYKTLRRHLSTNGLTAEQYRARYGLKPDYPMVAPTYSEARRAMAKKIGLGRKPGQRVGKVAPAPAAPRGRAKKTS
jgi:predicted transcriptional regulator